LLSHHISCFIWQGADDATILDTLKDCHFSVRYALCYFAPTLAEFWSALQANNFDIQGAYHNSHAGTTQMTPGSLPNINGVQKIAIGATAGYEPLVNNQMPNLTRARMHDCVHIGGKAVGLTADQLRQRALTPAALNTLAALDAQGMGC